MIKNRLLVLTGLVLTLSLSAPKKVFCAAGAVAGAAKQVDSARRAKTQPPHTYASIIRELKTAETTFLFEKACYKFLALINTQDSIEISYDDLNNLQILAIPYLTDIATKSQTLNILAHLYFLTLAKKLANSYINLDKKEKELLFRMQNLEKSKGVKKNLFSYGYFIEKTNEYIIDQLLFDGKMKITAEMIGLDRLNTQTETITTSQQRSAGLSLQAIPVAEEEGKEDESPDTAVETRAMAGHDRLTAEEQLAIAASEIDANIAQLSPLGLTTEGLLSDIAGEISTRLNTLASTTDLAKTVEDIAHRVLLITVLKQRGVMLKEASRENLHQELQKLSAYNETPDKATPQTLAIESNLRTALEETAATTSHGAGAGAGVTVDSSEDAIAPMLDRYQQEFKDNAIKAAKKSYNKNNGQIWINFIQSRGGTEAVKALWLGISPTKNIYQTLIDLGIATEDDMIAQKSFYNAFVLEYSIN